MPCTPEGVRQARQHARSTMARWGEPGERTETAALLTTELVTNAVLHGRGPEVRCHLRRRPEGDVQLRVWSGPGTTVPRPRPARDQAVADLEETGRGLLIVDGLSSAWGTRTGSEGRLVWADL
ncbi:ATP-binding protein [Streptomyces sp. N2-109]|uniref:ATP-binding protein n=1 Tax=Streptomyces gossypii TaxID=2883101 RepID=A0ABT2JSA3_9ACTN|nr:ATP-binding protein [Streptomyces gossypii]